MLFSFENTITKMFHFSYLIHHSVIKIININMIIIIIIIIII